MSLTSYRAAPPRVNSIAAPMGAGTYNRFKEDVKRLEPAIEEAAPLGLYMGICRLFASYL